jgi:hypothetical protein
MSSFEGEMIWQQCYDKKVVVRFVVPPLLMPVLAFLVSLFDIVSSGFHA